MDYVCYNKYDKYKGLRNVIYHFANTYSKYITCEDINGLFHYYNGSIHCTDLQLYVAYDVITYFTFKSIDNLKDTSDMLIEDIISMLSLDSSIENYIVVNRYSKPSNSHLYQTLLIDDV